MTIHTDIMAAQRKIHREVDQPSAASAGYSCWQLLTVQKIVEGGANIQGVLPMLRLPKSLIGKTVKVTIEELI